MSFILVHHGDLTPAVFEAAIPAHIHLLNGGCVGVPPVVERPEWVIYLPFERSAAGQAPGANANGAECKSAPLNGACMTEGEEVAQAWSVRPALSTSEPSGHVITVPRAAPECHTTKGQV